MNRTDWQVVLMTALANAVLFAIVLLLVRR